MNETIQLKKPKTQSIQFPAWWNRYLKGSVKDVVIALLTFSDSNGNNAYPSNELIAFMAGAAEQTVKNTKRKLIEIGIATRELVGTPGNQRSIFTINLEWNKDKYIEEFNLKFNNKTDQKKQDDKVTLKKELDLIQNLINEDAIDVNVAVKKLEALAAKLKDEEKSQKVAATTEKIFEISSDDVEKVAEYIMTTEPTLKKVQSKEIKNPIAYKKSMIDRIKSGTFNHIEKYFNELKEKEFAYIKTSLNDTYQRFHEEKSINNEMYYFKNIEFDSVKQQFFAVFGNYKNKPHHEYIHFQMTEMFEANKLLIGTQKILENHKPKTLKAEAPPDEVIKEPDADVMFEKFLIQMAIGKQKKNIDSDDYKESLRKAYREKNETILEMYNEFIANQKN